MAHLLPTTLIYYDFLIVFLISFDVFVLFRSHFVCLTRRTFALMPQSNRRCQVCGEMCFSDVWHYAHKVKESDLEFLKERHCISSLQSSLRTGVPICCRHFKRHNHASRRGGFELSDAPGELPNEDGPRKKSKLHTSKHLRRIKEEEKKIRKMFNGTRVTREQQHRMNTTATILGIDIDHKETTISEIYESIFAGKGQAPA